MDLSNSINFSASDIIQITIAIIMLVTLVITSYLSFLSNRSNKESQKLALLNDLIKEERRIVEVTNSYKIYKIHSSKEKELISIEHDHLIFGFYEQLSIFLSYNTLNKLDCFRYFQPLIHEVYSRFMNSKLSPEDRMMKYPFLTKLFNQLGLSIQKFSITKN